MNFFCRVGFRIIGLFFFIGIIVFVEFVVGGFDIDGFFVKCLLVVFIFFFVIFFLVVGLVILFLVIVVCVVFWIDFGCFVFFFEIEILIFEDFKRIILLFVIRSGGFFFVFVFVGVWGLDFGFDLLSVVCFRVGIGILIFGFEMFFVFGCWVVCYIVVVFVNVIDVLLGIVVVFLLLWSVVGLVVGIRL